MTLLSTTTAVIPEVEHGCPKVILGSFERRPRSSMANHGLALCCSGKSRARPLALVLNRPESHGGIRLARAAASVPPRYLSIGVGTSSTKKTRPHSRRSVEQSHGVDRERGRSDVAVVDLVEMKAGPTVGLALNSHWTLPRA